MEKTTFNFSKKQIDFLNSYCPKNRFFTTNDECNLIIEILGLKSLTLYEMSACRNEVVKFYSDKMKRFNEDIMSSLQSVTAVIDHYSKGYTA
jgi:hypothetical protein